MAKALNPLWNYKPRTQRIKLLQHRSLNSAAFLAWHFCYPHRFPDPGLLATQHLALKILQVSLKPWKVPWKMLQKLWFWGSVPVPLVWDQQGALIDAFWCWVHWPTQARTQFPLKSKHSNSSQTQQLYTYIYVQTHAQNSNIIRLKEDYSSSNVGFSAEKCIWI